MPKSMSKTGNPNIEMMELKDEIKSCITDKEFSR